MNKNIIYTELSYRIMQAVFDVHNTPGPGFIEQVYEEAVAYELELGQILFARQKPIQIYYKDRLVGKHRLDLSKNSLHSLMHFIRIPFEVDIN